jgi:Helix-turn-helix
VTDQALKQKAYATVNYAVINGLLLRPTQCSSCGKPCRPHGHHEDYTQPLCVIWLCAKCHQDLHGPTLGGPRGPREPRRRFPSLHRAARKLLGWSERELAQAANVPVPTVKKVEISRDVRVSALAAIEKALVDAGILFLDPDRQGGRGVRFKR